MKVNNQKIGTNVNNLQNQKSNAVDKLKNTGQQNKTSSASSELLKQDAAQVALSDRAMDMKRIKEAALKAPDVNVEKVKKLQELIDRGGYKVDAAKVADKMVDEHLTIAAQSEE